MASPRRRRKTALTERSIHVPKPKYILTSGPSDTINVWDDADLEARQKAAAKNPDLNVTVRPGR